MDEIRVFVHHSCQACPCGADFVVIDLLLGWEAAALVWRMSSAWLSVHFAQKDVSAYYWCQYSKGYKEVKVK